MHCRSIFISAIVISGSSGAACHRPVQLQPVQASATVEDYCWWAVFSTAVPLDTVAVHFAHAFSNLGLSDVRSSRLGDTIRVQAGPSVMHRFNDAAISARVVAYRRGDSTHFREYTTGPTRGFPRISFCAEIGRASAVNAFAPREPDGEEKLSVWTRRP
jgi:hypothetical protein